MENREKAKCAPSRANPPEEAAREADTRADVPAILVDLDTFKKLNKTYNESVEAGMSGAHVIWWNNREIRLDFLYYALEYMELVNLDIREWAKKHKITRKKV